MIDEAKRLRDAHGRAEAQGQAPWLCRALERPVGATPRCSTLKMRKRDADRLEMVEERLIARINDTDAPATRSAHSSAAGRGTDAPAGWQPKESAIAVGHRRSCRADSLTQLD